MQLVNELMCSGIEHDNIVTIRLCVVLDSLVLIQSFHVFPLCLLNHPAYRNAIIVKFQGVQRFNYIVCICYWLIMFCGEIFGVCTLCEHRFRGTKRGQKESDCGKGTKKGQLENR